MYSNIAPPSPEPEPTLAGLTYAQVRALKELAETQGIAANPLVEAYGRVRLDYEKLRAEWLVAQQDVALLRQALAETTKERNDALIKLQDRRR
jgi:hypothetical protein